MNAKDRKKLGELLAKIDDARIEIEEMENDEEEAKWYQDGNH